jgi:hypothetical protein
MIGCVVISDRGDLYLPATLDALGRNLDSEIPLHVIDDRDHQLGLAGAARAAWEYARAAGWDFLLHWEEDFRPVGPVPVQSMADALCRWPFLTQVVLKRQPWNDDEIRAGGIIEQHPWLYSELSTCDDGCGYGDLSVTMHRRIFSLNPCLIPRDVLGVGWPDGNEAEQTKRLCRDPRNAFAFFGKAADAPRVEHVGSVRGAGWRL